MRASSLHILGGGSLGALWAAHHGSSATLLVRSGLAARRKASVRQELRIERDWAPPHEATVGAEPSSASDLPSNIETLVVATKAFDAASALESVRPRLAPGSTVVLMCNGALSVAEGLALPPASSLLVATTTHGAWRRQETASDRITVRHAGNGSTWVGPVLNAAGGSAEAAAAAEAFAATGLGAVVESAAQTQRRLWLKLAANAVLNPLTALWDVQNGEVLRRDEGRRIAVDVCDELAALPGAPPAGELLDFVHSCAAENAENWSSMHQDVAAGRRTEVEQLNGWVVARARALDTPAEANEMLAARVREVTALRGS